MEAMQLRSGIINGGLALCSVVFFVGLVECALRVTKLQTVRPNPPKIYQTNIDPRISYELKPNLRNEPAYKAHVSTDSRGFRLLDKQYETNREAPLLVILGDSVAFGYGVEDRETLAARLSPLLPKYSVINAAVPGYSLPMESATYETKVAPLKPAAVMLVFFWNDLNGELPGKLDDLGVLRGHDWNPGQDACAPITEGILGLVPGKCWLDTHSAFYKAVKKYIVSRTGRQILVEERETAKASDFQDPVTPEQLAAYEKELIAFDKMLPRGMKKIFVIWPDQYIHKDSLPVLERMAINRGFTVINLYERFGNEAPTLPWDTVHPAPATLKEAADFIAPFVHP